MQPEGGTHHDDEVPFSHTAILRRKPDKTFHEPVWSVLDGGQLTFADTSIMGSFGWRDASSTVTITP